MILLRKAIERIGFTISKQNKPNATDAEAFNKILEHFKKTQEQTIQDNLLFAKLYTYLLEQFTRHYNDVNIANIELNKLLAEPMNHRLESLLTQLKFSEVTQVFADPFLKDKNETELREVFKTHKKYEKDFVMCWEWWDIDNVISHLNTQINLSIQNFKNNV